jgi:putative oxidoreductase
VRFLRHPVLHRLLGVALGAVFLYASISKIAQPRDFARIVYHYQVIGPNGTLGYAPANLLAIGLPWLEALVGALLVLGLWRREMAAVASGLLVLFVLAVGSALWRGIDIAHCGCFSVSGEGRSAGIGLILGDLGLLGAGLVLTLVPPRRENPAAVAEPAPARS